MKRLGILLITLIITIAIVLGAAWWLQYQSATKVMPTQATPTVTAVAAKQQSWQQKVFASGNLTASQGTILKNQADGVVESLNINSGTVVKQGTVLLTLNHLVEEGQLNQAQANYTLSQLTYTRNKKLLGQGVSQQDVDEKKADVLANKGLVEQAQGEYDQRFIKAPFTGKLGIRQVNIGDYLEAGTTVVNLQAMDPLYVDFYVPEQYANSIVVGGSVIVTAGVSGDTEYTGSVKSIESLIDADTGNISIRAQISNPKNQLVPGSYVNVTLAIGKPQTIITVPQTAIVYDDTSNYVYTIKNNIATKTNITIGNQVGDNMAISSGVDAGTQVISAGTNKVSDGSKVIIADED